MWLVWFVYVGGCEYWSVVFDAYGEVNGYLARNKLPVRLVVPSFGGMIRGDDVLSVKPGFAVMIRTGGGKVRAYSLEGIIDMLHGWLVKTRHEISEIYEKYYREKVLNENGGEGQEKNGMDKTKEKVKSPYQIPDTVIGVVSLPLVTRNPYLDFFEKFLGVQKQISGLNIVVVSASPFYHENKLIFSERLFKAILHELGHAFGLNHCSKNCVMNPPSTIKEWDSRTPSFCSKCFLELKRNVEWKANKCDNTGI